MNISCLHPVQTFSSSRSNLTLKQAVGEKAILSTFLGPLAQGTLEKQKQMALYTLGGIVVLSCQVPSNVAGI